MTEDVRLQRAAAVAEQLRRKAEELKSRTDALCDAADHRMQRSSELQAATRRLLRGIPRPIRGAETSYFPWTNRTKPRFDG